MLETPIKTGADFNAKIIDFIGDVITHLEMDKMIFEQNVATQEQSALYKTFIKSDPTEILQQLRIDTSKAFVGYSLQEYIKQLSIRNSVPLKLAFSANDAKILIWAVIKDDDEATENGLIMSEAYVNSMIHKFGFFLCTTIVEEGDELQIPPQFMEVKIKS